LYLCPFPDAFIKAGDPDREIVKTIQHRLNEVGCGPIEERGIFDVGTTKRAVKLFAPGTCHGDSSTGFGRRMESSMMRIVIG